MASAESVVSFLLGKVDSLLVEEAKLLKGVRREVRRIKDELESMRAFLRDADERAESNEGVKSWVKQVREVAYDIEDVLDEFTLHLDQESHPHSGGVVGTLHKTSDFIKHSMKRHGIASQIQDIRVRLADISSRKENYGFNRAEQGLGSNTRYDRTSHLRSIARFVEEANLVGIDGPRNELIGWLVDGESKLTSIAVVGMGGLGKTTMAGKVYDNEQVKMHFSCHAWITVSQSFTIEDMFRRMVKEFCGSRVEGVENMGKDELIRQLRSYLQQKRYIIVLDDLWHIDDWECIKIVLPDGNCGSRIMVTTRISDVATHCSKPTNRVYKLQPLSFEQGWTLFSKSAFGSDLGETCPPHLITLSERFVKRCGGLPLAIVAIGGLLYTRGQAVAEWKKVDEKLGYQIESSPTLTPLNQTLSLSINDLPYHLRSCFLYVSIFPEDYSICWMRLTRLWIAEGFVERKEGMTPEEIADDYLHELINRSLIQVEKVTDYGKVNTCRIHDVVREIIFSKSKEEDFMASFSEQNTEMSDKTRRLTVHCSGEIVPKNDSSSRLRSLFMFGKYGSSTSSLTSWFSGFRLLKVLDLENAGLGSLPNEIVNLIHLRFLSLRNSNIRTLLNSIGNLKNIETLDLRQTKVAWLPSSIIKLNCLRHLLLNYASVSGELGSLRTLQTLSVVKRCGVKELGKLTQLRELGIADLLEEDGVHLCGSLEKMKYLSSFTLASSEGHPDLESLSSPPPPLEYLYLSACLKELPRWIPSLSNLLCLILVHSELKEDPFSTLQRMPNLMELQLMLAYDGEELSCEAGGFPRLKLLFLSHLKTLRHVMVEKGAMPCLQKLHLKSCYYLHEVPVGIEHLTSLKELQLYHTGITSSSIAKNEGEDHWKIRHIPVVYFS